MNFLHLGFSQSPVFMRPHCLFETISNLKHLEARERQTSLDYGASELVIESHFWREDIARYVKTFRPVKNPPRWTERLVVNFEKNVTMALFMVRRLAESGRFSTRFKNHRAEIFRCAFNGRPHRLIYKDIGELYELGIEQPIAKDVMFVCNQFIHANFTDVLPINWTI